MKIKLCLLAVTFLILGCNFGINNSDKNLVVDGSENVVDKLRHVVLFKFKESSTSTDIQNIELAFDEMIPKIPEIKDFERGINNSPENLNKGFTHCYLFTFNSEEDRDEYLTHPAHLALLDILIPHIEDGLVVDYWTNKL